MKSISKHLRLHLESACKLMPHAPEHIQLIHSEEDLVFRRLCLNRKILGAMRYGLMGEKDKPKWDRITDCIRRLQAYQNDSNLEHLVDVANLCELEFREGNGVLKSIDDSQHVKEK